MPDYEKVSDDGEWPSDEDWSFSGLSKSNETVESLHLPKHILQQPPSPSTKRELEGLSYIEEDKKPIVDDNKVMPRTTVKIKLKRPPSSNWKAMQEQMSATTAGSSRSQQASTDTRFKDRKRFRSESPWDGKSSSPSPASPHRKHAKIHHTMGSADGRRPHIPGRPPLSSGDSKALQNRPGRNSDKYRRNTTAHPQTDSSENETDQNTADEDDDDSDSDLENYEQETEEPAMSAWFENDISLPTPAKSIDGSFINAGALIYRRLVRPISEKLASQYLAIDCEMVGVGPGGIESSLARVSIVDYRGRKVLDEFVAQCEPVTNYRTFVSGITESMLRGPTVKTFKEAQQLVADITKDKILVGHAIQNDLKVPIASKRLTLQRLITW